MQTKSKVIRNHSNILILVFLIFIGFVGCYPPLEEPPRSPEQALKQVKFFYPRFHDDMDISSLALAIKRNMEYLERLSPKEEFQYGPDKYTCERVRESQEAFLELIRKEADPDRLNKKIKDQFRVYRAAGRVGNNKVLFTGYFEPIFEGSLTPSETYKCPLYRKPDDLIRIDLSQFNESLKGKTIVARIHGNRVIPYHSRYHIEVEKALKGRGLEIVWLKDPVDVAFLHIQGSGRIRLPDGITISVGYHEANGRPYRSIGRYMLEQGFLKREQISMQSIRDYLSTNPEIIEDVLNHNPSYVFFRLIEEGPIGCINVPVTPGRSIALDSSLFPKGALAFISCQKPALNPLGEITHWKDFSRFVLNQDTGGAIKGAGRADIFWGSGPYAETAAGHLKHEGDLYLLIKKP